MASVQYPAQTGVYAIKVKSEQSTHNWQEFDNARLQISVGQDYHEGEKLKAVAEWSAPRFEKTIVCVNDTLQRYNLMFEMGLNEEQARDMSAHQGQEWLNRNKVSFRNNDNVIFIHWNEWLEHTDYHSERAKVEKFYRSNEEFKQAIDGNIMAIWERRRSMDALAYTFNRFNEFSDLSRQYLLEEITVFSMMFEQEKAIDIYPGSVIFAATVFQGQSIEDAPKGLGKGFFSRIDFSRRKESVEYKLAV